MPISTTQGQKISVTTEDNRQREIDMGRVYFVEDPNNATPLKEVCPPQMTTVLFIPVGVDPSKTFMIKGLFVSVDSREYVFNKMDDYNVYIASYSHEIVFNYETILDILAKADRPDLNSISYKGTTISVNCWMLNLKRFKSIIPMEIRLFSMMSVPRKFMKHIFVAPHQDNSAVRRSRFPLTSEVFRDLPHKMDDIKAKRLILERFHRIYAILNVNSKSKKLPLADHHDQPISIIPFTRESGPALQEIAVVTPAPNVRMIREESNLKVDITLPESEYDRLGRSLSLFTKGGSIFHIDGVQYASVPVSVRDGNRGYRMRNNIEAIQLTVRAVNETGHLLRRAEWSHAVIQGSTRVVRDYILANPERFVQENMDVFRPHDIVDYSGGAGFSIDQVEEMVRENSYRLIEADTEAIDTPGADQADGNNVCAEFDLPEYQQPSATTTIDTSNLDVVWHNPVDFVDGINPGREVSVEEEVASVAPETYFVEVHIPDILGRTISGVAGGVEVPGLSYQCREVRFHDAEYNAGMICTLLDINFRHVLNTVCASSPEYPAAHFSLSPLHISEQDARDIQEVVDEHFPFCLFHFYNVLRGVFHNCHIIPRIDGPCDFEGILVPNYIWANRNFAAAVDRLHMVPLDEVRLTLIDTVYSGCFILTSGKNIVPLLRLLRENQ